MPPSEGSSRENPSGKAEKYRTGVLLFCAAAESIGLTGLIYFILTGDHGSALLLCGISALALAGGRPGRDTWSSLTQTRRY